MVTYIGNDGEKALVKHANGETYVTIEAGETAEQAATRWAQDAFGVGLTPAPLTLEERVAALEAKVK